MAQLESVVRFRTREFETCLPRFDAVLEANPIGLEAVARIDGVGLDDARAAGYRSIMVDERAPHLRSKITARWSLASKGIGHASGGFGSSWGSMNHGSFAFGELPTWTTSVNWVDVSEHTEQPWVSVNMKITGPRSSLLAIAGEIRTELVELFATLLEHPDGLFGYASVDDGQDSRILINGFDLDDAADGVFSYDWITWVPRHLADRLAPTDVSAAPVEVLDVDGGSGGVLVVTSRPPIDLSTGELRLVRHALVPALLPTNPDSAMRKFLREHDPTRSRPEGLLPEDWL